VYTSANVFTYAHPKPRPMTSTVIPTHSQYMFNQPILHSYSGCTGRQGRTSEDSCGRFLQVQSTNQKRQNTEGKSAVMLKKLNHLLLRRWQCHTSCSRTYRQINWLSSVTQRLKVNTTQNCQRLQMADLGIMNPDRTLTILGQLLSNMSVHGMQPIIGQLHGWCLKPSCKQKLI